MTKQEGLTKERLPRTIYWDKEMYRQARILAANHDMTVNALIRELVRKAVEDAKNEQ